MDRGTPSRVLVTPAALALIDTLRRRHGPALLFYQSHGCCDGSTPMCLKEGEMPLGQDDRVLGHAAGVPFYVGPAQWAYLQGGPVLIDARPGGLGTFSLEDGEAMHFTATQARLWTEVEALALAQADAGPGSNPMPQR